MDCCQHCKIADAIRTPSDVGSAIRRGNIRDGSPTPKKLMLTNLLSQVIVCRGRWLDRLIVRPPDQATFLALVAIVQNARVVTTVRAVPSHPTLAARTKN